MAGNAASGYTRGRIELISSSRCETSRAAGDTRPPSAAEWMGETCRSPVTFAPRTPMVASAAVVKIVHDLVVVVERRGLRAVDERGAVGTLEIDHAATVLVENAWCTTL